VQMIVLKKKPKEAESAPLKTTEEAGKEKQ
jgi:hypothetical protein